MTRKLLLLIFFFISLVGNSQRVFKMMMENADRTINNPSSGYALTSIAHFKKTALIYMKNKVVEQQKTDAEDLLDTQAYYLAEFTKLYIDELIRSKSQTSEKQKETIMQFVKISKDNPLFYDADSETTDTYISEPQTLTPFSLDTNWEKAFKAAKEMQDSDKNNN